MTKIKKQLYKSKLYKIRLVKRESDLFGEPVISDQWDTLCRVIDEDYRLKRKFKFVHPHDKGKEYIRHYALPVYKGFALANVGQFKNGCDYAVVAINIKSLNYEPYVVLADYPPSFTSPDILAEMIERAFNWVLADSDLKVVLEPWDCSDGKTAVMWKRDCVDTYMSIRKRGSENMMIGFGHEKLVKVPKEPESFRDYLNVPEEKKDAVMELAHKVMDKLVSAKAVMRIVEAMIKTVLRERPPYQVFANEFGEGRGRSSTSYSENTNRNLYDNDSFIGGIMEKFIKCLD